MLKVGNPRDEEYMDPLPFPRTSLKTALELPIVYRLVILKHLKNYLVLMKNESNQQLNENA